MAHLEITHYLDDEGLRHVLFPRSDIVKEMVVDTHRFGLLDGPFEHYERSIFDEGPTDSGLHKVTESFDYKLSIPWFGFIFSWDRVC